MGHWIVWFIWRMCPFSFSRNSKGPWHFLASWSNFARLFASIKLETLSRWNWNFISAHWPFSRLSFATRLKPPISRTMVFALPMSWQHGSPGKVSVFNKLDYNAICQSVLHKGMGFIWKSFHHLLRLWQLSHHRQWNVWSVYALIPAVASEHQWALLLTWMNFNTNMDKKVHAL